MKKQKSVSIPDRLVSYKDRIDDALASFIGGRDGSLQEMAAYHLGYEDGAGNELQGKAIRPSLSLFTVEALGGEVHRALPAAVSLELIHNFSLIHDDIQDDAELRRGRKSVQAVWGSDQAINAGDGVRDLATLALVELSESQASKDKILRSLQQLTRASYRMIEGQVMDLNFAERTTVTEKEYMAMIGKKTCALLRVAFRLGSIYGESDHDTEALDQLGLHLGYLYQIRDDWLGIWGQADKSGKSALTDLIEKKKSYPVVYALEHGEGVREKLTELYQSEGQLSRDQATRVRELIEATGAKEATGDTAGDEWGQAARFLRSLSLPLWARNSLEQLGEFLLHRDQ